MSTQPPARRTASSMRFAAVAESLDALHLKLVARLTERRRQGHHDLADEQIDWLARIARICAHDAVALSHELGRAVGRREAREALGLDPDPPPPPSPEADTVELGPCPLDGRPCPVPVAAARKR